jgi:hypothetical protein
MIYLVITTSLIKEQYEIRKQQYIAGINSVLKNIENKDITLIIVENNGQRKTFLDDFTFNVLYTNSNLQNINKGNKELQDIQSVIKTYNIKNEDLIIKFTGRYLLNDNNKFLDLVYNNKNDYDCFIRYGSYMNPIAETKQVKDCVTGLIAMKSKYIKKIKFCNFDECIEWNWALVTYEIDNSRIKIVDSLDSKFYVGRAIEYISL